MFENLQFFISPVLAVVATLLTLLPSSSSAASASGNPAVEDATPCSPAERKEVPHARYSTHHEGPVRDPRVATTTGGWKVTIPNPRRHGWRGTSLVIIGAAALVTGGASVAIAQDEQPFVAEGQAEGEVVVATAGGTFQEALGDAFYGGFTEATGINVTPVTINPRGAVGEGQGGHRGRQRPVGHRQRRSRTASSCSRTTSPTWAERATRSRTWRPTPPRAFASSNGFLYILGGLHRGDEHRGLPRRRTHGRGRVLRHGDLPGPALHGLERARLQHDHRARRGRRAAGGDAGRSTSTGRWPSWTRSSPTSLSWWETGDQVMQALAQRRVRLSTFWAGRVKALQREGCHRASRSGRASRETSRASASSRMPLIRMPPGHSSTTSSRMRLPRVQRISPLATNYDPANVKADPADGPCRRYDPGHQPGQLERDACDGCRRAAEQQAEEIAERWQEWISQ